MFHTTHLDKTCISRRVLLMLCLGVSLFHGCAGVGHDVALSISQGTGLKGWHLDEYNTGLAGVGINRYFMPLYRPPEDEVDYGTWYVPAGSVIIGKRIEAGGIDISNGNIIFERCWFHPSSIGRGMPLIHGSGDMPNSIRDCDIDGSAILLNDDGTNPACGGFAVNAANISVLRCNIQGFGSGLGLSGSYPVTVEGNYIHDLVQGEWFLGSGESHQDGLTMRSFTGALAVIRNNHILTNPPTCAATGAVFMQATWADCFLDNIHIEGNLLAGYGYNLIIERNNGGYGINIRAINNRFDPYNGWLAYVEHGPGWAQWQENYMNDPVQPDHKGAVAAEPMTQSADGLNAPGDLLASSSAASVHLSWTDNSEDELGFKIQRSPDGVVFSSVAITEADAISYTDTGLEAHAMYYYRVAAVNDDGISMQSGVVGITTPDMQ